VEEKVMKEKELERLNSELFGAFDPEDESWLVGGSKTITMGQTATPNGPDIWMDLDFPEIEQTGSIPQG
jgi:hypothetical protein